MNNREQEKQYIQKLIKESPDAHSASISDEYGDWRFHEISDHNLYLPYLSIQHLLTNKRLEKLSFDNIAWKGMDLPRRLWGENCMCCDGIAYKRVDIDYPPILVRGASNHFNKLYRMIDGRHRMMKMILNGLSESLFYILDLDDIKEYFISPEQNNDWSVMCIPLFGDGKDYASRHQTILKENYNTLLNNLSENVQ